MGTPRLVGSNDVRETLLARVAAELTRSAAPPDDPRRVRAARTDAWPGPVPSAGRKAAATRATAPTRCRGAVTRSLSRRRAKPGADGAPSAGGRTRPTTCVATVRGCAETVQGLHGGCAEVLVL